MPATIHLRTIPGGTARGDRCNATTLDLFGPSLGQETILRRIGLGLPDRSDRRWRGGHDIRLHSCEAAGKATMDEAAGMGCEP